MTAGVLAAAVAVSFGAAWSRGARRAWWWHLGLAAGALVALAVFSVGQDSQGPGSPEPPALPRGSVCRSGGDSSECAGG